MYFEHLIEINDPGNPLLEPLTRTQLWRGLMLRAEQPELSVMSLDQCIMHERRENYLRRELKFGKLSIHDEVFFETEVSVTYHVAASDHFPASRLVMQIEEPYPDRLFVRFTYSNESPSEEDMVRQHVEQAYVQADQDTVAVIREQAKLGKLGISPN